jgi:hypothetical protein
MTRLLNTPDIGRFTASVASSSIDMLAGLAKWPILSVPPGVCADAGCAKAVAIISGPAIAEAPR